MEVVKIGGREYPVLETVTVMGQAIPRLSIRMMSDERERELSRREKASA